MSINSDNLKEYKQKAMQDFQKSNGLLKKRAQDIHNQYVQPVYKVVSKHAGERPITSAFGAIFLALSFVPLVSFAVFSIATLLITVGIALFWSAVLISGATIALLVTLLVTASIAIGLAFWAILGYESYRLVSHVLAAPHLVDGFKSFEAEARSLFLGASNESKDSAAKVTQAVSGAVDNVASSTNGFKVE